MNQAIYADQTIPDLEAAIATVEHSRLLPKIESVFRKRIADSDGPQLFRVKHDGSPVCDFEISLENAVGKFLSLHTPWANIIGEEGFSWISEDRTSPYRWHIDPIDGSISFKLGLDGYSCVACLNYEQIPIAAVAYFPKINRGYSALLGRGLWSGDRRVKMPRVIKSEDSMVAISDDYTFRMVSRDSARDVVKASHSLVRTVTDLYGHSLVSEGSIALKFDAACALWDRYPAELFVREAGGETIFIPLKNATEDLAGSLLAFHPSMRPLAERIVMTCENIEVIG